MDYTILRFGFQSTSICSCCRVPKPETVDHVFATSELATKLWTHMARPLGILHNGILVQEILNFWWNTQPRNQVHKLVLHITPYYILLELWKARFNRKSSLKNTTMYRIANQVLFSVQVTIAKRLGKMEANWRWETICLVVERYKTRITGSLVYWDKPQGDTWKLNTYGNFIRRLILEGIWGNVRKGNGNMIMVFAKIIELTPNNLC